MTSLPHEKSSREKGHVLTGFGFGPIQAGLFVNEAYKSCNFQRIVIAEINPELVDGINGNRGKYSINVARIDGIDTEEISGVELINPSDKKSLLRLKDAIADSTEIVTSLPSVDFYTKDEPLSVARLIADGLSASRSGATLIYAAENNHRAAEILESSVKQFSFSSSLGQYQFVNTVIGKMSHIVTGDLTINNIPLTPIVPGYDKAFLVEEFNNILTERCTIEGFSPGINVFDCKKELKPFEEAKLYGHNAVHAMLAYRGLNMGIKNMAEAGRNSDLMNAARNAFYNETGPALRAKHAGTDELFTEKGYRAYADDLLRRMVNPYLGDTMLRASRNVVRKLGSDDRIIGAMALCLDHGITPANLAAGAVAALRFLMNGPERNVVPTDLLLTDMHCINEKELSTIFRWLWKGRKNRHQREINSLIIKQLKG